MRTKQVPLVLGIDAGTSGVRLSVVDVRGKVVWTGNESLDDSRPALGGVHEQEPSQWWNAVCHLSHLFLKECSQDGTQDGTNGELVGISVTSTSGTLVPTDLAGNPVRKAILYDDQRASSTAERLTAAEPLNGSCWAASHSFSKAVWLRDEEPQSWAKVERLLHPTDWITGKLSGNFGLADHSNVLKLGYEPEARRWNTALERSGILSTMLPTVVRSGEVVGSLCSAAIRETGLPAVDVIAGATDGVAGLIASGAALPGDANTTLGTTLVWKVLSSRKPSAGLSGIYSHLHPSGLWAPGAASNTGPGSLQLPDGVSPSEASDRAALPHLPSHLFCYPISGTGERFPVANSRLQRFVTRPAASASEWYAAQLQAIAFVERWGYEVLEQSGVPVGSKVFSTGGATSSHTFCRLRASVMKRQVLRCSNPNAAFGAAVLAASAVYYGKDVSEAIRCMTHITETHTPDLQLQSKFDDAYEKFRDECRKRGYDT